MSQPNRAKLNIRKTNVEPEQSSPEKKEVSVIKVNFRIKSTAKRQLDKMAFMSETTKQKLFNEALNDLFRKYGKPEIA